MKKGKQKMVSLEEILSRIALVAYNKLPVTATPEEFLSGHGNWGLTESEYQEAKRLAEIACGGSRG